ncbi:ribosomal large subunit pseudouridine synthase A [Vibrio mimicus]|uniref:RluA family pseudouridine synthase n=1 Tax=Vibrio mimicus TaxID=674 RepID=UPI0002BB148B|nr:RluA family pseudouridine synthase [Vibrio mimicus]EMB50489.1 Pseudouridylate synthase, 23S RNA-specific [Vibrio mimicus CAIM 602]MBY7673796.1 RNA pseudouridine synthase [Vibrio mimicus]MBY7725391.1 RNA pseudouridine synthase [Vibrio mimicus]TXY31518.1 RNA pseudouridine synthase [Vibrio mimicus]SUQ22824.1 ribosomal large subunit pseudouridine synthase A [Vibrio mimicus]
MSALPNCFTHFISPIRDITLPKRFTYPFCYQPHPLCEIAASELQQHLLTQTHWYHPFGLTDTDPQAHGKMFGVLVVQHASGELGYLSAFSGQLAEQNELPRFVPPVFDRFADKSFFRIDGDEIASINQQVREQEADPELVRLTATITKYQSQAEQALEQQRVLMAEQRQNRKQQREQAELLSEQERAGLFATLAEESVFQKRQLQFIKQEWEQRIATEESLLNAKLAIIEQLKQERKQRSAALQKKLFTGYRFANIAGVEKNLVELFSVTKNPLPPAGSGECAAPKLLHYAFQHQLKPIALAEFWWGRSPKSEIRQHKKFYPACQSKCQPILAHMLQGMELDDNPLLNNPAADKEISIVYQDEAIVVVNKPAEFLSVPGVHVHDSVLTRLQAQFSEAEGVFALHRLDMSTSGLLVFALTRRANKHLQKQFITRAVQKRYVAMIEGTLTDAQGEIELPLCGDLDDRPRQKVCWQQGKPALTHWETVAVEQGRTRVYLYPHTGRTHQLRVHCAHHLGLNCPIVGDDLYGTQDQRLHLHAEKLSFSHPYTKQPMTFEVAADF